MEFTGVCSSPSPAFAGSLPLSAASTSPSPFAANGSPLVSLLAPPSSSSSPLVLSSPSSSPLIPTSSALPERPQVPLGLLVVFEGMVWSPDPEPAPHQRSLVPAPRQRPPVPAPRRPVQLTFASAGPVQLTLASAGPVQLAFCASRAPPRLSDSRAPTRVCASRAPTRVCASRAPQRLGTIRVPTRLSTFRVPTKISDSRAPQELVPSSSPLPPLVPSSSPWPTLVPSSSPGPPLVPSSSPLSPLVPSNSPLPPLVPSSSPLPPLVPSSSPWPPLVLSSLPSALPERPRDSALPERPRESALPERPRDSALSECPRDSALSECPRTSALPAVSRQHALPGEWRLHPEVLQLIWRRFGDAQVDLFASPDTSHCQLFFSLSEGTLGTDALACSWPRGLRKYAFPPVSLLAQTLCKVREDEEQVLLVAPYWPNRTWFPELMLLATAPPWQIPLRRETFSERGHPLAPAPRLVESPRMVLGRDAEVLSGLTPAVVNTITSARALSTRQAYRLKWNLFVDWCSPRREDPRRCPIAVVLSFLQDGLERRLSPSTLKVYVAAIAAHHDAVDGKSLGKHDLVIRFLRGARRLNPPRPHLVPSWDLPRSCRPWGGPPLSLCSQ